MAKIITKNNHLLEQYKQNKRLRNWSYVVIFVDLMMFMFSIEHIGASFQPVALLCMILFLASGFAASHYSKKTNSLHSGLQGEEATAKIIASLPDTYTGFQNIQVTHDGKTSELDMAVVGPTGVFIIETKNMNGTIVGNYEHAKWVQEKIGRKGTPYSKNFHSPIKQVGTHVYRLAHYLRGQKCNVHIDDIVYFSNPDTTVRLTGTPSKTPVFSASGNGGREICNYILENEQVLSKKMIAQVVSLLESAQ